MVGVPSDPDRARSNPYRASPIEIEPDRLHIGRNRIHIGPIKSRTNPNRAQSKPSRATAIQIQPKSHRIQAGLIESRSGHSNPEGIQIESSSSSRNSSSSSSSSPSARLHFGAAAPGFADLHDLALLARVPKAITVCAHALSRKFRFTPGISINNIAQNLWKHVREKALGPPKNANFEAACLVRAALSMVSSYCPRSADTLAPLVEFATSEYNPDAVERVTFNIITMASASGWTWKWAQPFRHRWKKFA